MDRLKIQIALFFKDSFPEPFEKLSLKIKSKFKDVLNTEMPAVPKEFQNVDIPRLIVQLEHFSIQASIKRVDIFYYLDDNKSKYSDFEDILKSLNDILKILNLFNVDIVRLGYVDTSFLTSELTFVSDVVNLKTKNNSLVEFSIRLNEIINVKEHECNNIQKIEFGILTKDEKNENGQFIFRDINTKIQNEYIYSPEELIDLVKEFYDLTKIMLL